MKFVDAMLLEQIRPVNYLIKSFSTVLVHFNVFDVQTGKIVDFFVYLSLLGFQVSSSSLGLAYICHRRSINLEFIYSNISQFHLCCFSGFFVLS